MGCPSRSRGWILRAKLFGLVSFLTLAAISFQAGSVVAQSELTLQSGSVHYRVNDPMSPRLGFLLPQEIVREIGWNFQLCDGTRISIDLVNLIRTQETCGQVSGGAIDPITFWSLDASTPKPIYSQFGDLIGEVRFVDDEKRSLIFEVTDESASGWNIYQAPLDSFALAYSGVNNTNVDLYASYRALLDSSTAVEILVDERGCLFSRALGNEFGEAAEINGPSGQQVCD